MAERTEEDLVRDLLHLVGEDPHREGLRETPHRFLKAWKHYCSGYSQTAAQVLKTFEDGAERCGNEIVLVSNLRVSSSCEHHLAPVWGLAHIGYIPNGKIVGLSKFQRLVDVYGRRLQVQERLTNQIADALWDNLNPLAVGVVLECRHACMEFRGVSIHGTVTVTSALRGGFKTNDSARAEFLSLVQGASRGAQI